MNADLVRHVVVRAETDASPRLPLDLLTPANPKDRIFEEICAMHLGREGREVVWTFKQQRDRERLRLHPPLLCG